MLRRLSNAASLLSPVSTTPSSDAPPVPSLPHSLSSSSLSASSPSLTEALSSSLLPPPHPHPPSRTAQAQEDLLRALEDLQRAGGTGGGGVEKALGALATIQLVLQEEEMGGAASFFGNGGFEVVVGALAGLGAERGDVGGEAQKEEGGEGEVEGEDDDLRYHFATLIFHVLHLALSPSPSGCTSPSATIDPSSFTALSTALSLSHLLHPTSSFSSLDAKTRTLSLLWAFLVGDFSDGASALLVARSKMVERVKREHEQAAEGSLLEHARAVVAAAARGLGHEKEEVHHPQVLPIFLDVLEKHLDPAKNDEAQVRLLALVFVEHLLLDGRGEQSVVRLREAGLLEEALRRSSFSTSRAEGAEEGGTGLELEREVWMGILKTLLRRLGAGGRSARALFEAVEAGEDGLNEQAMEMLVGTMKEGTGPSFVELDLARRSSCVSLRSLGRPFPPPTHGYSFLAWIFISSSPRPSSPPLILFSATDPSSKTFFEFSLTPSLHVSLQTSLRTPAVIFSAANPLASNKWHHLALTHQRPSFGAGNASLYIDGVLTEVQRAPYPAAPPKDWDVSAWFGTPRERSPPPAPVSASGSAEERAAPRWRMGPAWLLHGELGEEMVFVSKQLGARYEGNLQDTLGRFLTNSTASSVNLRLDSLTRDASSSPTSHSSKPSSSSSSALAASPLVYAVRHKASAVVPEHRLYFSLFARNVLSSSPTSPSSSSSATLSPPDLETLKLITAKSPALINAALPSSNNLSDAVLQLHALAYVENATVVLVHGIDDALYAAGGLALVLRWVERAKTPRELELAVGVFAEAVGGSWRLSEEGEERQAYEVLGLMLRRKAEAGIVNRATLQAVLALCGFGKEEKEKGRSVVVNTLATQHVLLDLRIWRGVEEGLQRAHVGRIRELVEAEKGEYNLRKLNKLHVVRKLIFAIRMRYYSAAVAPQVVDLALLVLRSSFTTDSLRYVCTFLAASLTDGSSPSNDPSIFINDARTVDGGAHTSALQLLQGLHDILLDPDEEDALAKFSKHIQTKWLLLFIQDRRTPSLALVLITRILVRLLQASDSALVHKFQNRDSYFTILRHSLPPNLGQVHAALFALLHGKDISTISLEAPLSTGIFSPGVAHETAPEIVSVVIAMIAKGLKVLDGREDGEGAGARTDGAVEQEEKSTTTYGEGFRAVIELLDQAGRLTAPDSDVPLISSNSALTDLVRGLVPVLHLPTPPEYPPTALLPVLPVLSSANCYELPRAEGNAPSAPVASTSKLSVDVPAALVGSGTSPFTAAAVDAPTASTTLNGRTFPSALLVLDLLAEQIVKPLLSRQTRRSSSINPSLPQLASSDPALQPLRIVLDCGATADAKSQVVWRTLLVRRVLPRLGRAGTASPVVERVVAFVEVATAFALEGWIASTDVPDLLRFVLSFVERLLDETALSAVPTHDKTLASLYTCLDRLLLLSFVDSATIDSALQLLSEHHLAAFSPHNDDPLMKTILAKLIEASQTDETTAENSIHVLKLLALQRPEELNACFKVGDDSQTSFVHLLLETEDPQSLIHQHLSRTSPPSSSSSWDSFLSSESARARKVVEKELARLQKLAAAGKQKRASHRRRLRGRRGGIAEWAGEVREQDATRAAHARQDDKEHVAQVEATMLLHAAQLKPQPALGTTGTRLVLDFTEGPHRQRKKLRIETLALPSTSTKQTNVPSSSATPHLDTAPTSPSHSPPTSPTLAQSELVPSEAPIEAAAPEPVETVGDEDKMRRVKRLLVPGDRVESVYNVHQVAGVDTVAALLLLGKHHCYLVDSLFYNSESGEILHAFETPDSDRDPHLQILADLAGRNTRSSSTEISQVARHWSWLDLSEVVERRFLFRDTALELFFGDGQSYLLTFSHDQKAAALEEIKNKNGASVSSGSLEVVPGTLGAKLSDALVGQRTKLEQATRRWTQRQISNFEYLSILNNVSGRTTNDISNYPVFPWVLSDCTSETLDLEDEGSYRDLSKPMGAQNEKRKREFEERYAQLEELGDGTPPFHYGTHYSAAVVVAGYLVRLQPYTDIFLDLQGGSFDSADRSFWSIAKAWESASALNRSDVRELTPEFFCLPDFLSNANGFDLGRKQDRGSIDDVELPPWARGNPRLFIERNREALESEYVSMHLSKWIDLIFGYKQQGPAAKEAVNVFSHLSYEGRVDLDKLESVNERKAATSTLHNFGLTPRQLFNRPHPSRRPRLVSSVTHPLFSPDLPVEAASSTLIQTILPIATSQHSVVSILPPPSTSVPEKIQLERPHSLNVPGEPGHAVQYGFADGSIRVIEKGGGSVPVVLVEGAHTGRITKACFADKSMLLTASDDSTIVVWHLDLHPSSSSSASPSSSSSSSSKQHLTRLAVLRACHAVGITALAVSKAWSIVVSGDAEGTAVLWDLNRFEPVRILDGSDGEKVEQVAISETTGDVVVARGSSLSVYTLNGTLLAEQATGRQPVTALAWSKSETSPIVATGHPGGRVCLWRRVASKSVSGYSLHLLTTLHLEDRLAQSALKSSTSSRRRRTLPNSISYAETVTSLAFTTRTLYVGTGGGKVLLFNPPGTEVYIGDGAMSCCMSCQSKFTLLETRRRCGACAGIFCSLCTATSVEVNGRYCASCLSRCSLSLVGH